MLKVKPYEQIIAERAAAPKAKPSIESISLNGIEFKPMTSSQQSFLREYLSAAEEALAQSCRISAVNALPSNDRRLELQVTLLGCQSPCSFGFDFGTQVDQLRVAADANSWDEPSTQAYAKGLQQWMKSGE